MKYYYKQNTVLENGDGWDWLRSKRNEESGVIACCSLNEDYMHINDTYIINKSTKIRISFKI